MLTRQEILDAYTIRDGAIANPGKFEGEPIYAPALHECCDDDYDFGGDGTVDWYGVLIVDAETRAAWPEIGDAYALIFREDDQGFVGVTDATADQVADLVAEYESYCAELEPEGD